MIDKMVANFVPLLLLKVRAVAVDQKRGFAMFLGDLCTAYASGDRMLFEVLLEKTTLPAEQKQAISAALWTDDNQT